MSSNESTLLVTEGQYVAKLVISTAQSKFTIDSIFSLLGEYALIFFTILVVRAWVMQYFSFQVGALYLDINQMLTFLRRRRHLRKGTGVSCLPY